MSRAAFPWSVLTLACLSALLAGCGERQVQVKGRVTYNGTPLKKEGGRIVFVDPKGTQVVAPIDADGNFLATKVAVGPNRVAVYYSNPQAASGKKLPSPPQKDRAPAPTPPAPPFTTPYEYAAVDTSGLAVEVQAGTVFDAALIGPPIR